MKKLLSAILVLVISLQLFSCEGVYTPPAEPPVEPCPPHADTDKSGVCDKCGAIVELPGGSGGEEDSGEPFTVSLTLDGEAFIPEEDEAIFVQWTDGFAYHSAKMEGGVASVSGLDGDYRVTLTTVPDGYAYNPNIYTATNDERDIEIELHQIKKTRGTGANLYQNIITLTTTGVYSTEIKRASQKVYYQFRPTASGTYTVESWIDVTENNVNPTADIYYGTFAAKFFGYTQDDGGAASTYTKNFVYTFEVDASNIGSVYTFGLKISEISGKYPQKVVFAVKKDGEFERPKTDYTMVIPTYEFEREAEYDSRLYTYKEAYTMKGGVRVYDGSKIGFNDELGCYCLFNEETGRYDGPIIYAKITLPTQYIDRSLAGIELDNNALKVSATEDYSLFIKGWAEIVGEGDVWLESLTDEQYRLYSVLPQAQGYATYCNSDGVYRVTEELKDFLQKFSISQLYFRDGDGWVEQFGVFASEEDQWLFACGYYVEK